MRMNTILTVSALLSVLSVTAEAGNLTNTNGKAEWKSTACAEPTMPVSLLAANRESQADDMNTLMAAYNAYSGKMQDYMNCLSNEAQKDSTSTDEIITGSAQASIDAASAKVTGLHNALQSQK